MSQHDPAKAVQMLDLLLEFFADGAHWMQGDFQDEHGNRCVVGALEHLRHTHAISKDGTRSYLSRALPERGFGLMAFNDSCKAFDELRAVIVKARELAAREQQDPSILRIRQQRRAEAAAARRAAQAAACEQAQARDRELARFYSVRQPRDASEMAHDLAMEQAAAVRRRRLIAELEQEHIARIAAGDTRAIYILCPEPPCHWQVTRASAPAANPAKKAHRPTALLELVEG